MTVARDPAVWFPAVRTGTGTDVSTQRLAAGLEQRGIRTGITWLPLRAEYAPWTVPAPATPAWATIAQVNTWLPPRFVPGDVPVVATIRHSAHRPELDRYKGPLRSAYHRYWIRPAERRVLQRADTVVAVSNFAAETARSTLLDRPMRVIPNGVDTSRFRPAMQPRAHTPFRLLYVGKWGSLKGVDLLPAILRELGGSFELRYTGGPATGRDKLAMPDNMTDLGRLKGEDSVIAALQAADAFLFPSRSEGLPLSVLEAMACGLPVVATRGSSLVEVVEDGVTGLLCEQDGVGAFVDACRALAGDSARHAAMSSAARVRALRHFSIDGMYDAYVRLYKAMLVRSGRQ